MWVFAILVAVVVFFTLYSPDNNFIRVANLKLLGAYGSEFGIVAIGVGLLMIAVEFDLSVGSVLAFSMLVFTWTNELSINPFIGLLITLAAGVMTGLINGLITVRGKIVSFITTLGAMWFWRGLTLMLSRGEMQAIHLDAYPLFTQLFIGKWFGFFPAQFFWFLLLVVILTLVLHFRRFGNWIFSTGDNALAARSMAINTDMVKIMCFSIVGVLTAFAAVLQTTRLSGRHRLGPQRNSSRGGRRHLFTWRHRKYDRHISGRADHYCHRKRTCAFQITLRVDIYCVRDSDLILCSAGPVY